MAISKRKRFEVFKRDSFTCQYCGRKAPDVLLEVDHIHPKSKSGKDDMLNLITSCKDCNGGKSDKLLNDTTVIEKQREQLAEMQERKEQLSLMFEWQKSLLNLDQELIEKISGYWHEKVVGYSLTEAGIKTLKALIKKYPLNEILSAIDIAADQYLVWEKDQYTHESVNNAWNKVGGICYNTKLKRENPELAKIHYLCNALQKRFTYFSKWRALNRIQKLIGDGIMFDIIEGVSKTSRNWTDWNNDMDRLESENGKA